MRSTETFKGVNPATGEEIEPTEYVIASKASVDEVVRLADSAFPTFKKKTEKERAAFLRRIGEILRVNSNLIVHQANLETALPVDPRLKGELERTVRQLHMFADLIEGEDWREKVIFSGEGRSEIYKVSLPVGPVAIFGASNFPLAFSVCGGDTASALAAGCPVVVKAHPCHPGTSELVAGSILRVAQELGMPEGVFSMVHGGGDVANFLVGHAKIKAAGFTGSRAIGRKLYNQASARLSPIPVFAEMGSVNPVVVTPDTLVTQGAEFTQGLVNSITLGVGQFCTNPGLVFALTDSPTLKDEFRGLLRNCLREKPVGQMLSANLCAGYRVGVKNMIKSGLRVVAANYASECTAVNSAPSVIYETTAGEFVQKNSTYQQEVFGPSSVIIFCDSKQELLRSMGTLQGQLTGSIHATEADLRERERLISDVTELLTEKVGRVIFNEFPTGVEVCNAMMHGGPYPATTDYRSTSVGKDAIKRWLRPVAFQNVPVGYRPLWSAS